MDGLCLRRRRNVRVHRAGGHQSVNADYHIKFNDSKTHWHLPVDGSRFECFLYATDTPMCVCLKWPDLIPMRSRTAVLLRLIKFSSRLRCVRLFLCTPFASRLLACMMNDCVNFITKSPRVQFTRKRIGHNLFMDERVECTYNRHRHHHHQQHRLHWYRVFAMRVFAS